MKKYAILLGAILLGLASALSYAQAPVPFISLPLVPDATPPGGPEFTLKVNGTGFVSNSVVNWNGTALATQYVSGSQLTAAVPAANIATAGTASVAVVNPAPGGASIAIPFEITTPVPSPTFSRFDVGGGGPDSVVAADFTGDGNLDVAGVSLACIVSVYLGDGHGGFTHRGDYAGGPGCDSLVVGDFNGDGIPDLALRGGAVLLGNGDGSFQAPITYPVSCGGAAAVGDFNGDGKLDIACTDGSNVVYILLGNGDGTFQNHVSYATGSGSYAVAVGDFNGDGKLDLAIAVSGAVAILLGNGDGTFQSPVNYPAPGAGAVYAADLNGDGVLDLVKLGNSPVVSVLLGNGDGTFRPHVDYAVGSDVFRGGVADVNGDGKLDVVATTWAFDSDQFLVLLGNGDGTLGEPIAFTVGACPLGAAFGDFNKDGMLDVAIGDQCGGPISVMLGVAPGPAVTLSPTSLTFGMQLLRTASTPQYVTLTNTGTSTLDITNIAVSTNFLQKNTCGSSLASGANCIINVTFYPHNICTLTGSVTITDSASNSPQTVSLTGVGTIVTVGPSTLDFGTVPVGTTSQPQTVTLTNYGKRTVTVHGVRFKGVNNKAFAVQSNACGSVPAGGNCGISIVFTPHGKGPKAATLLVDDDGGASPQWVALSGVGTE